MKFLENFPFYVELRIVKRKIKNMVIKNEEINVSSGYDEGAAVTVIKNKKKGFSYTNTINKESIVECIKKAEKLSQFGKEIEFSDEKGGEGKHNIKEPLMDWEEMKSIMKECKEEMKGDKVKSFTASLKSWYEEKTIMNNKGEIVEESSFHGYFSTSVVVSENNIMQQGNARGSSISGYDIDFLEISRSAREKAELLLSAKTFEGGRMDVVLDPEMTGVFTHEVVGHASEGDSVKENESILKGKKGEKIGNEKVNIVDDPTAPYFGNYFFDDEGVRGKKVMVVEEGVLKNYLTNKESTSLSDGKSNGHGRAENYDSPPIVRMSNTFFLPGKDSKEDVFDIKNGIYVKGMRGGSVDPFTGNFMFTAEIAYRIEKGELKEVLRDVSISGNILEVLKNIESVGKDFATSPGFCGKSGQSVPVSDGGPHIRVKNLRVG